MLPREDQIQLYQQIYFKTSRRDPDLLLQTEDPVKNKATEGAGVVAHGHKNHLNLPVRKKKEEQFAVAEAAQVPSKVSEEVGNSPPNSSYAEVIKLVETDEVPLFKKKNYKLSVSIGLRSSNMRPLICVVDRGTEPNTLRSDL